jgi:uncharacterized protein YuzE
MTFTYDPRYNIAYVRLKEKNDTVKSISLSDELVVDIGSDGTIYGIELLNASHQLKREDGTTFLIINEATGRRQEIPLDL